MTTELPTSLLESLSVTPALSTPLYQQIYDRLRTAILSGQIPSGARLPSTRALANALGISRNTVLNAYDQLLAEGYLKSKEGSGTIVAPLLPETLLSAQSSEHSASRSNSMITPLDPGISARGRAYIRAPGMPKPLNLANGESQKAFQLGLPAFDSFPFEVWNRCLIRRARYTDPARFGYQASAGYRPLREAIAAHLIMARGVRCTADQVIIVNGSQGALDLSARVLLDPGDPVWIEDPGYLGARGALIGSGATLVPVPVDGEGLDVAAGIARCPDARLVYVTPSHQFPMAVTMSLSRRLALLEWAKRTNAWILEDDYNSEYRFAGRPLGALQGLDQANRVIYIGTFSKVLFPALRIGYLVVPDSLIDAFAAARQFIDIHVSPLEQGALADFIEEGHFVRHIRRMRNLYAERRELLIETVQRELPLEVHAPEAGMHIVGWLPAQLNDKQVSRQAASYGIYAPPISLFALEPLNRGALLLGYASVTSTEIRAAVQQLKRAINSI